MPVLTAPVAADLLNRLKQTVSALARDGQPLAPESGKPDVGLASDPIAVANT
jgi:hypothetical protein